MGQAVYPDSVIIEYGFPPNNWLNIYRYVVGDITASGGLDGWKPDQRVAVLGTLNFTLNNKAKLFSPMGNDGSRGLNTLGSWNKGVYIRISVVFEGKNYVIWIGRITAIDSDDKNWGNEQTRVTAVDWMEIPASYPMKGATIALNQTIDSTMALILARLSVQPVATSFDPGAFTFPAVFDNVKNKTMAASELTKLANSELGYIYVKHDGTLKVENALARAGQRALDQIWITPDTNSFLLKEDGFYLLKEDGGKIILDEGALQDAALAADAEAYNITLDQNSVLNSSIIRAFPVVTDTSLKVLYSLGSPLLIPAGISVSFSAHYTDPNGNAQVSGTNMQAPAATTDYLANTLSTGAGTDKTANIVVTATYFGDTVYYSIVNNATVGVYVTMLKARGYGIYYGNSIESTIDDANSQAIYGYVPFQFDQRYQKNVYAAAYYGLSVIEEYKTPKSRITKMKYLANLNKNHLMSFLMLTIGALILGTEDRSGISNYYYITDRAFTIKQGGIINVEYGVKQNDSYLSGGLNPLTVEFNHDANGDGLNYGYLPLVSGDTTLKRTFSSWFYQDTDGPSSPNSYVLMSTFGSVAGDLIYSRTPKVLYFFSNKYAGGGRWQSPDNAFTLNAWHHFVITMDEGSAANDPIIYIDGASVAVTESLTPSGAVTSEVGNSLVVGNLYNLVSVYTQPFDGKLFDARVYNRILTAAEVTTLYNGGTPDKSLVTNGLVFQGPALYDDQGDLTGFTIGPGSHVTENAFRAVGIPHGAPVIRANP